MASSLPALWVRRRIVRYIGSRGMKLTAADMDTFSSEVVKEGKVRSCPEGRRDKIKS